METFRTVESRSGSRNASLYQMDRFTRNNVLFGFSITCFIMLIYINDEMHEIALITVSTVCYYAAEASISLVIRKILLTGEYYQKIPYNLLLWCPIIILALFITKKQLDSIDRIHETTEVIDVTANISNPQNMVNISTKMVNSNFMTRYYKSILITCFIFYCSCFTRALFTGLGLFSSTMIRRGIVAIFQRIIVLIRSVAIFPVWVEDTNHHISWKSFGVFAYISIHIILVLYILYDTHVSLVKFLVNKNRMLKDYVHNGNDDRRKKCCICTLIPEEPKSLHCGKVACYCCAYHWLTKKPECTICKKHLDPPLKIDMSDGYIPLMLFLASV
ncbi:hypothetical protein TRFO_34022 [Tritrichomonas foetus]|uniref:RING-type domain-containing protein n=1 Tax=Tritrichomonas foetus TaxID=1144522 RepID=A0A1J4JK60_9EUKA|nr:hypothetical protein TRFO_34022 [Tritrichomonas foetus]|eukprot:OHS99520.1 hypothetical protein TRFO_34022 [Tritrichomonas foetus]